jgi:hypothetical protein
MRLRLHRLRVFIGLLAILIAGAVLASPAELAPAATEAPGVRAVVLPYANANGYTSTRVIINPTDEAIVSVLYDQLSPVQEETFPAHSAVRTEPGWPRAGVNIEPFKLDERLVPYTEIRTPLGTICHVPPLEARSGPAEFYDLPPLGEFEAYVFVASEEAGYVTVNDNDVAIQVARSGPDTAALVPLEFGPRAAVTPGWSGTWPPLPSAPSFYTFAIVVHDATGAITVSHALP